MVKWSDRTQPRRSVVGIFVAVAVVISIIPKQRLSRSPVRTTLAFASSPANRRPATASLFRPPPAPSEPHRPIRCVDAKELAAAAAFASLPLRGDRRWRRRQRGWVSSFGVVDGIGPHALSAGARRAANRDGATTAVSRDGAGPSGRSERRGELPSGRRTLQSITDIAIASVAWLPLLLLPMVTVRAASAATAATATAGPTLTAANLVAAAGILGLLGGLAMRLLGLPGLSRAVLTSALRCTVQLFLLGAFFLERLFGTRRPLIVFAWIAGVGLVAAHEAMGRVDYSYPNLPDHVRWSVLLGGGSVLSLAIVSNALGTLTPRFDPRTLVPVAGMVFGNTLSAAALGAGALTREFAEHRDRMELRLARGASAGEAALPAVRAALRAALTPTINAMSVVGIVHMPGMMTGQILAGQSAYQASAYQVMIMFLIASAACAMVLVLAGLVVGGLFDKREHVLLSDRLCSTSEDVDRPSDEGEDDNGGDNKDGAVRKALQAGCRSTMSLLGVRSQTSAGGMKHRSGAKNAKAGIYTQELELPKSEANTTAVVRARSESLPYRSCLIEAPNTPSASDGSKNFTDLGGDTLHAAPIRIPAIVRIHTQRKDGIEHSVNARSSGGKMDQSVLKADHLTVKRTGLAVSFDLREGDRLGVTGKTGIGKTQLLRAIARLDPSPPRDADSRRPCLVLRGEPTPRIPAPLWRRRVCWVSQDRPTVPGTSTRRRWASAAGCRFAMATVGTTGCGTTATAAAAAPARVRRLAAENGGENHPWKLLVFGRSIRPFLIGLGRLCRGGRRSARTLPSRCPSIPTSCCSTSQLRRATSRRQ